jgi:hypothetical protein
MTAYPLKAWSGSEWVDISSAITNFPDQVGNSGKVLVTDGTDVSWGFAGAVGGGSDAVFYENDQTITTSYTIGTNKNAVTAGPISIDVAATITIPSGSVWSVV